jgi:hypothetical protein
VSWSGAGVDMRSGTHQGNRTLQLRNTAASPSSRISDTTALPSWNTRPPSAGNSANARGRECHPEMASWASSGGGWSRDAESSWRVRRAEEREERESIEIRELRRRGGVGGASWWEVCGRGGCGGGGGEREVVGGRSGDSERAERRAERGRRNWADSEEVRVRRGGGELSAIVFAGVVVVEGCGRGPSHRD